MSESSARLGDALLGSAVTGASDMPDSSRDRFTWEGHCWELVTDPDLDTALVRPGGSAIAQEEFAARLANILKLNVGNLIVTEGATINEAVISKLWVDGLRAKAITSNSLIVTGEAILNHATLIGQTVVDDINVAGKLIGTDGVFTGTVDFENVNVTGLQLVEKLEANSISADLIEGGAFTGESFTGGTFVGGEFRTSDALPGQVVLADDAVDNDFNGGTLGPGIRVTPADTSDMVYPASIGPSKRGLTIYGGRRTTGGRSIIQCNPDESFLRTFHEGGAQAGVVQTSITSSQMRTYREDGTLAGEVQASASESYMRTYQADGVSIGGSIQASGNDTFMQTYSEDGRRGNIYTDGTSATVRVMGANGLNTARVTASGNSVTLFSATNGQRYLELNDTGIWIRTGPSGNQKVYNLEETAQDSGWISFPTRSGITENQPTLFRNNGGLISFRGVISANWTQGWNTVVSGLTSDIWPSYEEVRLSPISDPGYLLRMTTTGTLQVWAPSAGSRAVRVGGLVYPTG